MSGGSLEYGQLCNVCFVMFIIRCLYLITSSWALWNILNVQVPELYIINVALVNILSERVPVWEKSLVEVTVMWICHFVFYLEWILEQSQQTPLMQTDYPLLKPDRVFGNITLLLRHCVSVMKDAVEKKRHPSEHQISMMIHRLNNVGLVSRLSTVQIIFIFADDYILIIIICKSKRNVPTFIYSVDYSLKMWQ